MPLIIPTRTDLGIYQFSIELEGVIFIFRMIYNTRDASWFFDLLDIDSEPISLGVKCVTNFPLLRLVVDARRPAGELYVVDTTGEDRRAGLEDLGDGLSLVYFDSTEVPASFFGE